MFISYQNCFFVLGLLITIITAAIPYRKMECNYKDFAYLIALICFGIALYLTDWTQPFFTNPFSTTL